MFCFANYFCLYLFIDVCRYFFISLFSSAVSYLFLYVVLSVFICLFLPFFRSFVRSFFMYLLFRSYFFLCIYIYICL